MEEYEWAPNIELLEIFPDHICGKLNLIYHGTSIVHSHDIERNGLSNNYSPLPNGDLQRIINLLGRLGQPSDFDPQNTYQYNFNYAGAIHHYLYHLDNHPISFTTIGFAAVQYASGNSKGGQIIGKIKNALNYIQLTIDQLPLHDPNKESLTEDFEQMANVATLCEAIEQGQGVVYSIRPCQEELVAFKVDHNVVFSFGSIRPENIIAKIIIPANYFLGDELIKQIKEKGKKHLHKPRSIGHTLIMRDLQNEDN